MNAVFKATCVVACVTLLGCGNKGDLFIDDVTLTDEQKAMLEELEASKAKKKRQEELEGAGQNDLPNTN